jgi:hypothetical protein
MITYNITVKVSAAIASDWVFWQKETHMPEVLSTGCFTHAQMLELLEVDNEEGPTYVVQFFAESKAQYNLYHEKFAAELRQKSFDRWGNQFIAFRSVMKLL